MALIFPGITNPNPDIVVGAITDYDYSKIEPWVVSLERCGFTGTKVMICYNINAPTIAKLKSKGFAIAAQNYDQAGNAFSRLQHAIVVRRFFDLWKLSKLFRWGSTYRHIITTDVKDVIFQRNPSEFLSQHAQDNKTINVGTESLTYAQEPWGNENMFMSFGADIYESLSENTIYNCGTISGRADIMQDLFLNIYLLSCNAPVHNADQAALNVILNMKPWSDITRFNNLSSGYACQLGTTNDPSKMEQFTPFLQEKPPILDSDGLVKYTNPNTNQLEPFYLVHQYDRIPKWKFEIERKYRE